MNKVVLLCVLAAVPILANTSGELEETSETPTVEPISSPLSDLLEPVVVNVNVGEGIKIAKYSLSGSILLEIRNCKKNPTTDTCKHLIDICDDPNKPDPIKKMFCPFLQEQGLISAS